MFESFQMNHAWSISESQSKNERTQRKTLNNGDAKSM